MIMSCKMAHSRYVTALQEAKKTHVGNEKEKKRKMIDEEKCCKEAAEKHDISFFLKSNDMRVTVKEKESLLEDLDSAVENVEKDKKKAGK